MNLPNDLIKATDYSKAKNREIHEFEYRNGKYIHKYVLGGEHELTPQEIIDCLNAISTIDCDLQTAYAFIQSQKDKINSLENGIVDDETLNTLVKEHKFYKDLETKLAESEENNKLLEMQLQDMERSKLSWENQYFTLYNTLKNYREVTEKKLTEKDKLINNYADDIEKVANENADLVFKLAEKEKEIKNLTISHFESEINKSVLTTTQIINQDKISFCIKQLEKAKEKILNYEEIYYQFLENNAKIPVFCVENFRVRQNIDNQIAEIKKEIK